MGCLQTGWLGIWVAPVSNTLKTKRCFASHTRVPTGLGADVLAIQLFRRIRAMEQVLALRVVIPGKALVARNLLVFFSTRLPGSASR
jgi:hypothetical protein